MSASTLLNMRIQDTDNRIAKIAGDNHRYRRSGLLITLSFSLHVSAFSQAPAPTDNTLDIQELDSSASDNIAIGEVNETALPVTWLEAQIEFNALLDADRATEALLFGRQMLSLIIAEFGDTSAQVARAHQSLADAEQRAGEYDAAELNYLRAIEVYRSIDGPFNPDIIDPTIRLGDNYFANEQFTNAASVYGEARSIQRRVYGLLSEEQTFVLERISQAFEAMGMYTEADEQQRAALTLIERNYPVASPEHLQGIFRYAQWLRMQRRFFEERAQYERAVHLIREAYDKQSILLVEPYREIGNSFRNQSFEDPRGASALNAALNILEEQADPDPLEMAITLVDIGDWKTAFSPISGGHDDYMRAWNILGELEKGDELRAEWFTSRRPIAVLFQSLSVRGLAEDPLDADARDGSVLVRFDLDIKGKTENVTILESTPPGFKDEAAARAIRLSRFRPHIENDEFVPAIGLGLLFSFSYMPDDVDIDVPKNNN